MSNHCVHKRDMFVFKSCQQTSPGFQNIFPCYVNFENLCMLLSLSATFPLNRDRCKCTGTFVLQSMHDLTPASSRANFCKVVNGVLNISPPFFSVDHFWRPGNKTSCFLMMHNFIQLKYFLINSSDSGLGNCKLCLPSCS